MGVMIRSGDQYRFTDGDETVVTMVYCDEKIPTMFICEACGTMVHSAHVEVHAAVHGWKK